jgi:hypothetical protein
LTEVVCYYFWNNLLSTSIISQNWSIQFFSAPKSKSVNIGPESVADLIKLIWGTFSNPLLLHCLRKVIQRHETAQWSVTCEVLLKLTSLKIGMNVKIILNIYVLLTFYHRSNDISKTYCCDIPIYYQNDLAMKNIVDVTGGKPIAAWSQSISGVNAVNPLVTFFDIQWRKREVIFFLFVPDTTRELLTRMIYILSQTINPTFLRSTSSSPLFHIDGRLV